MKKNLVVMIGLFFLNSSLAFATSMGEAAIYRRLNPQTKVYGERVDRSNFQNVNADLFTKGYHCYVGNPNNVLSLVLDILGRPNSRGGTFIYSSYVFEDNGTFRFQIPLQFDRAFNGQNADGGFSLYRCPSNVPR